MATSSTPVIETVYFQETCINRLKVFHTTSSSPSVAALFGRFCNGTVTVLGCARCASLDDVSDVMQKLPGGIRMCGLSYSVSTKDPTPSAECLENYDFILSHITQHDPVIVFSHSDAHTMSISRVCALSGDEVTTDIAYDTTTEKLLSSCLIARAVCYVPFTFALGTKDTWTGSIHSETEALCGEVSATSTTFHLQSSSVLLSPGWTTGLPEGATCGDLASYQDSPEGGSRKKKAKTQKTLVFDVYTDLSGAGTLEKTPSCAPVINYSTEKIRLVSVQLPVDVVAIVEPSLPAVDLAELLCDTVCQQLAAMEKCICRYSKRDKFITPVPYHFNPLDTETMYTLVYPGGFTDAQLESHRREVHKALCLPEDRPLFRLTNRYVFPEEQEGPGYLMNVHEGVGPSKVTGGTQYLVKGHYTYHHYMQDRFDDNKWGCAYRSLQTLVSWFRLQGYTDKPIPDHGLIQQTLVDIGDKEPNFVGSKKWIGSMEVSFVLDTILGVTSKILNVSSGAELAGKGRELAAHFTTQGTPVMIGGGVLAHTILGVDYNEVTGDINFLILDPHYTGAEDLKTILDKGWCGWKGPEFWDKNAHYNMCLPQRPSVI